MFTKQDDKFTEIAVDPVRRRAAIAELSQRRTRISWVAMLMFTVGLLESWSNQIVSPMVMMSSVMGLFSLSIASKMESDLRLLMVVDRQDKVN